MRKTRAQSMLSMRNSVNTISGAYTVQLIDKLYEDDQKIQDMDILYFALAALFDTNRVTEGMHLIHGLFGIAGMDYSYPIAALEPMKATREAFVNYTFVKERI